jgi:hypothetical protein
VSRREQKLVCRWPRKRNEARTSENSSRLRASLDQPSSTVGPQYLRSGSKSEGARRWKIHILGPSLPPLLCDCLVSVRAPLCKPAPSLAFLPARPVAARSLSPSDRNAVPGSVRPTDSGNRHTHLGRNPGLFCSGPVTPLGAAVRVTFGSRATEMPRTLEFHHKSLRSLEIKHLRNSLVMRPAQAGNRFCAILTICSQESFVFAARVAASGFGNGRRFCSRLKE